MSRHISKTAQSTSPASAVPLPPPPTSNAAPKPLQRQTSEFDAEDKEALGKQYKTNKNITNYKTIVSSSGVSLVRIKVPTVSPRCSNAWNSKGKRIPKIWKIASRQLTKFNILSFVLNKGEDEKKQRRK